MIGLTNRDIDKDTLMIFVICYEYAISFTNMLRLFQVSKKYFWIFMEICSPMIKMGVRKAACIRKSVEKILACLQDPENNKEELTHREEKIMEAFTWFFEDSFTDGEACLHISQFESLPFARGYAKNGLEIAHDYKGLVYNLERLAYIEMAGNKFYKTSRFLYYMEKYSGDTDLQELNNLSVKEMTKRISEGERKLHEKEKQECFSTAEQ